MRDHPIGRPAHPYLPRQRSRIDARKPDPSVRLHPLIETLHRPEIARRRHILPHHAAQCERVVRLQILIIGADIADMGKSEGDDLRRRSEEHTSELQSLMRISYAVFCLKKKKSTYQDIIH